MHQSKLLTKVSDKFYPLPLLLGTVFSINLTCNKLHLHNSTVTWNLIPCQLVYLPRIYLFLLYNFKVMRFLYLYFIGRGARRRAIGCGSGVTCVREITLASIHYFSSTQIEFTKYNKTQYSYNKYKLEPK